MREGHRFGDVHEVGDALHASVGLVPDIVGKSFGGFEGVDDLSGAGGAAGTFDFHGLAFTGDVGAAVVCAHAAVAGTDFDSDAVVEESVEVDGDLVPGKVDVTTVACTGVGARGADIEGRDIGAVTCGGGADVAEGVADALPVAAYLTFDLDGDFGIFSSAVLSVLEGECIPDEDKGVLRAYVEFVAEHLSLGGAAAVVAQTDGTGEGGVGGEV